MCNPIIYLWQLSWFVLKQYFIIYLKAFAEVTWEFCYSPRVRCCLVSSSSIWPWAHPVHYAVPSCRHRLKRAMIKHAGIRHLARFSPLLEGSSFTNAAGSNHYELSVQASHSRTKIHNQPRLFSFRTRLLEWRNQSISLPRQKRHFPTCHSHFNMENCQKLCLVTVLLPIWT